MSKHKIGYFSEHNDAGYIIMDPDKLITSWEYIYQNTDILLKVDQNGPVYAQAKPVEDIFLFKRENYEKHSKWQIQLHVESKNIKKDIVIFSTRSKNPYVTAQISYTPYKVTYLYDYVDFLVKVNFMVPQKGMQLVSEIKVINQTNAEMNITLGTSLLPYINYAVLPPWDKPEWYLRTNARVNDQDVLTFVSEKTSPTSNENEHKTVFFQTYVNQSVRVNTSLERYLGSGDFYEPLGNLNLNYQNLTKGESSTLVGYPAVYAYKFMTKIKPNETFDNKQVITVFEGLKNEEKNDYLSPYLEDNYLLAAYGSQMSYYSDLFDRFKIDTHDKMFDRYINTFLPLQLDWVKNLDRGWPSGMRGVRDSSNDFMGILNYNPKLTRDIIIHLFSCQFKNGWLPRQVSANGKNGKHDLRKYNDGGVFLMELVIEYMMYTNDRELLDAKTSWLDSEEKSTILEHLIQAINYYIDPNSIGIHGLVKIYEGDWLDSINKAGLNGAGETVTITFQLILVLKQLVRMFDHFNLTSKFKLITENYQKNIINFEQNVNHFAYNQSGFYNGIFTDGGDWVFSDNDPDGASRIYMTANAYAIISGTAKGKQVNEVIKNLLTLKSTSGYRLFYPGLGKQKIDYLGRMGTGDQPIGLWENGTTYNHSSHGFFSRALSIANEAQDLLEVIKFMLPYDQKIHPIEKTLSPPYAIVNCYQDIEVFPHRGGLPFLTGTIAMAFRAIYNWMFGIQPVFGGIMFKPCLTDDFNKSKVKYNYNNKVLNITFKKDGTKRLLLEKERLTETYECPITGETHLFIPSKQLKKYNEITVYY